MKKRVRTLLLAIPLCSVAFAEDAAQPIRIMVDPVPMDSLPPPATAPHNFAAPTLHNPLADQLPLSLTIMSVYQPPESLGVEAKAVAGFPVFWAKVEKENGIDELRAQLGMGRIDPKGIWKSPMGATVDGQVYLDFFSIGSSVYNAWRLREESKAKEDRFQAQVQGLMGLTRELSLRKGDSPAISVILAKLDFMGKRVKGELPKRYDRKIFTENLKAWAVNPLFDSTALGPRLIELCRAYEEYEK